MLNLTNLETRFALDAVRQASQLVKQVQLEMTSVGIAKLDRSPVTIADYASQALVACLLSELFPNDILVAEEDAAFLRSHQGQPLLGQVTAFVSQFLPHATDERVCNWIDRGTSQPDGRFWTLDPLDGTKGFLRGDQYAVALAMIAGGQVQLGVLSCPNLSEAYFSEPDDPGSLIIAVHGQGAWTSSLAEVRGFDPLQVSGITLGAEIRILRSFEAGHTNVDQVDSLAELLGVQAEPLRMDSQAKYALLAAGQGDLIVRLLSPTKPYYREKIWDQAVGSLIVEEAGGRITDLDGMTLDFTTGRTLARNRGVVASNGEIHEQVLRILHEIGA